MADTAVQNVMDQLVRVDLVKFVPVTPAGEEILDEPPRTGYLVHTADRREFGYHSFGWSDSYTLEYDVYRWMEAKHPELARDIRKSGGYYLNGRWCEVSTDGVVLS